MLNYSSSETLLQLRGKPHDSVLAIKKAFKRTESARMILQTFVLFFFLVKMETQ